METATSVGDQGRHWHRFWELWRQGKFYEAHEALETLWKATPGPERWFLNGLIHCAVARYQHRRGNAQGAARQLVRARAKLAPFQPRFAGVGCNALLQEVQSEIAPSESSLTAAQQARLVALQCEQYEKMKRHFPEGRYAGEWEDWNGR